MCFCVMLISGEFTSSKSGSCTADYLSHIIILHRQVRAPAWPLSCVRNRRFSRFLGKKLASLAVVRVSVSLGSNTLSPLPPISELNTLWKSQSVSRPSLLGITSALSIKFYKHIWHEKRLVCNVTTENISQVFYKYNIQKNRIQDTHLTAWAYHMNHILVLTRGSLCREKLFLH